MGGCCPGGTHSEVEEPSPATKRRQLAELAEKRQADNVNQGVKVSVKANMGPDLFESQSQSLVNLNVISSHFSAEALAATLRFSTLLSEYLERNPTCQFLD